MEPPIEEDNTSSRLDRIEAILEELMIQSRRTGVESARVRETPARGASDQEQGGGGQDGGNTPDRSARAGGTGDVTLAQPNQPTSGQESSQPRGRQELSQPEGMQEARSLPGAGAEGERRQQQLVSENGSLTQGLWSSKG